jgi:hypothetical protein
MSEKDIEKAIAIERNKWILIFGDTFERHNIYN